jgi:hypothetical protein
MDAPGQYEIRFSGVPGCYLKSVELELQEKREATVRLKLVSKGETDRIRKALGI